jgi:C_GCAxxG_C_C family probable redox protein
MLTKDETVNIAASHAEEEYLCSEAVLMALAECLGVESKLIPKVATGFGAGVGREGEVCGALSGAVMGLGLKFGREVSGFTVDGRRPYWYATELTKGFRGLHGDLRCRDLLGLDLTDPEDYRKYSERNMWRTRCRDLIASATELAYDLLENADSE